MAFYVPQIGVPKVSQMPKASPQEQTVMTMQTMPEMRQMPQMAEVPFAVVDQAQPIAEEPAGPLAFLGGLAGGLAAGAALVYSLMKSIGQQASVEAQKLQRASVDVESPAAMAFAGVRRTADPRMQLNPMGSSSPFGMQPAPLASPWDIKEVSRDGKLMQRVEGTSRKTWKFNDLSKDRVQVALSSEGRPINSDIQLWLGPDWTPFKMTAYSEDGRIRLVQTIVGTRNKEAMIEVRNIGEFEFPFSAASNYAQGSMATLPLEIPANTAGECVDGGAIRSFLLDPATEQVEVVLKTDGRQLNARIELLNAPNNAKQTYECFTNNGELNSLCVAFNSPDAGNTIRIINLAPVEFPCYIHLRPKP